MTSNLGSSLIREAIEGNEGTMTDDQAEKLRDELIQMLRATLRPGWRKRALIRSLGQGLSSVLFRRRWSMNCQSL